MTEWDWLGLAGAILGLGFVSCILTCVNLSRRLDYVEIAFDHNAEQMKNLIKYLEQKEKEGK